MFFIVQIDSLQQKNQFWFSSIFFFAVRRAAIIIVIFARYAKPDER